MKLVEASCYNDKKCFFYLSKHEKKRQREIGERINLLGFFCSFLCFLVDAGSASRAGISISRLLVDSVFS